MSAQLKFDTSEKLNGIDKHLYLFLWALDGYMPMPEQALELLKLDVVQKQAAIYDNKALCLAAGRGYTSIVVELLKIDEVKRQAAVNNNKALRLAVGNGHITVVIELLKIDAVKKIVSAEYNEALRCAVKNGHSAIALELLKIDQVQKYAATFSNEALRLAAKNGHIDVVVELLKIDTVKENAAENSNEALHWAIEKKHTAAVIALLEIDKVKKHAAAKENSALRTAARNGYTAGVIELLKIDAVRENATIRDNEALYLANSSPHIGVVVELLKIDAVVEAVKKHGRTLEQRKRQTYFSQNDKALHAAVRQYSTSGHTCMVFELIRSYKEINIFYLRDDECNFEWGKANISTLSKKLQEAYSDVVTTLPVPIGLTKMILEYADLPSSFELSPPSSLIFSKILTQDTATVDMAKVISNFEQKP